MFGRHVPALAVAVSVAVTCWLASAAAAADLAPSPGAPGLGDPYFPLDGNGGYDVRHYDLTLRYDPASDVLTGRAAIAAKATQDLSSFDLDLVGLDVRSITVGGRAATWTREGQELTVVPASPLRAGRRFTAVVAYDGVPQTLEEDAGIVGASGFLHTDDGALVAGEPHGAAYWYPVNDHPLDKASYTFRVTAPKGLQVVANGELTARWSAGGWTTWTWDAAEPMASYLATVDVGEFDVRSRTVDGIDYVDAVDPDLSVRPAPRTGERFALSQAANATYKRLTRTVDVPASGGRLTFYVQRDTEPGWDFFFVEARTPGADDWTTLPDVFGHTSDDTGASCPGWLELHPFLAHYQTDNGDGTCSPAGTTGTWAAASGASDGYEAWAVDLSPYAGARVQVSLTYVSDDAVNGGGVEVDDIAVPGGAGSTSFEADGNRLDGWRVPGAPAGSPRNANDWIVGTSADAPPSLGELADEALAREPDYVRFLSGVYGPYPFSASGAIVDDEPRLEFALETQTRPVYAGVFFYDRTAPNDFVVVHELAHQWVGDLVSVAAWRDIWLNEGFATYSEWLWSEHEGRDTADQIFDNLASIPADDPLWGVEVADPGPDAVFDDAVYVRGAMTLHALRRQIGDQAFFRLLRRWVATHAGGNGTTQQFTDLAERVSGQDLDALFAVWLHTKTKPPGIEPAGAAARSASGARPAVARALRSERLGRR